MDAKVLIEAISSQMSVLQGLFTWTLIVAVGVAWAGLREEKEISLGGLVFDRRSAFYVVAALYFAVTLVGLVILWRLEALLILLPDGHFVHGYTKLASHEWVMNPFGYLGTSAAARRSAIWGTGLLIVGWWVCLASVYSLRGREPLLKSLLFPVLFYATGLLSLWVIYEIYQLNLSRLQHLAPELFRGLKETASARWNFIFAGVPIGVLAFILIIRLPRILPRALRRD
jgi:hypothetical protein